MRILEHRREQDRQTDIYKGRTKYKSPHILAVLTGHQSLYKALLAHRRHYYHCATPHPPTNPPRQTHRHGRFLYNVCRMNASLTRTPATPSAAAPSAKPGIRTPRRAASPVGLGRNRIEAAEQARGGAHKRSLTSQGARRIRSAPAATEPRRHPDPAAAAVLRNLESRRPKGKAFSAKFLLIIGSCLLRALALLGRF